MTFDTSTVFSDLKLGHKGLLSKKIFFEAKLTWVSLFIHSQPMGRWKKKILHLGHLLIPLEHLIEEKKNFFSKNVVFWFFQKKSNFPMKSGRELRNSKFSKFFQMSFQKCSSYNQSKNRASQWFFSGELKNRFG